MNRETLLAALEQMLPQIVGEDVGRLAPKTMRLPGGGIAIFQQDGTHLIVRVDRVWLEIDEGAMR